MSKIKWDLLDERIYQTGCDHGVLFKMKRGKYQEGVPWNGLVNVTLSNEGGEVTKQFADNMEYFQMRSVDTANATIECYYTPEEFDSCDGKLVSSHRGLKLHQQRRDMFGFSWRSKKGNASSGDDYGFIIHVLYQCISNPAEISHSSINDSPEAATLSYEVRAMGHDVKGKGPDGKPWKPVAHIEFDSTLLTEEQIRIVENILYGVDPLPAPVSPISLFSTREGEETTGSASWLPTPYQWHGLLTTGELPPEDPDPIEPEPPTPTGPIVYYPKEGQVVWNPESSNSSAKWLSTSYGPFRPYSFDASYDYYTTAKCWYLFAAASSQLGPIIALDQDEITIRNTDQVFYNGYTNSPYDNVASCQFYLHDQNEPCGLIYYLSSEMYYSGPSSTTPEGSASKIAFAIGHNENPDLLYPQAYNYGIARGNTLWNTTDVFGGYSRAAGSQTWYHGIISLKEHNPEITGVDNNVCILVDQLELTVLSDYAEKNYGYTMGVRTFNLKRQSYTILDTDVIDTKILMTASEDPEIISPKMCGKGIPILFIEHDPVKGDKYLIQFLGILTENYGSNYFYWVTSDGALTREEKLGKTPRGLDILYNTESKMYISVPYFDTAFGTEIPTLKVQAAVGDTDYHEFEITLPKPILGYGDQPLCARTRLMHIRDNYYLYTRCYIGAETGAEEYMIFFELDDTMALHFIGMKVSNNEATTTYTYFVSRNNPDDLISFKWQNYKSDHGTFSGNRYNLFSQIPTEFEPR